MRHTTIATATKYQVASDIRLALSIETLQRALKQKLRVVIVDDSPPHIQQRFSDIGIKVTPQKQDTGFGSAIRQAIAEAASMIGDDDIIAWQEPEKVDLVRWYNVLTEPIESGRADIVMPKRTEASHATYPIEQIFAEKFANQHAWLLSNKTMKLDWWFGPKMFRKNIVPFFLAYQGSSWDSLLVPIIRAVKAGHSIEQVTIDYHHPNIQRTTEENKVEWSAKRFQQLCYVMPILEKEFISHI